MSSRGAGNAASTSTRGVSTSRRTSPRRWDVVRTELVHVDSGVRPALVRRLLREFVSPGGSLLVCRYGDRTETAWPLDVELREELASWGCSPAVVRTGTDVDGRVRTAVAVVHRP
jgi:hypothetical protein